MSIDKEKVVIFDTTMRDGEQSPGIEFSAEDKVAIAEVLTKLGVNVIESGYPKNKQDFEATQAVAQSISKIAIKNCVVVPVICGLARAKEEEIETCWQAIQDAPKPRIHTFASTSDIHMKSGHKTPRHVVAATKQAVEYAKQFTDDVEFSPMDATRSDIKFMLNVIKIAVDAGATTINIPDTTGYITPKEFERIIAKVVEEVKKINPDAVVSAHCHDDLGMAVVNSMVAIMGGARQVECTINGIGERAGNAALEEIVANLIVRPDIYRVGTDINSEQIQKASQAISNLSGYDIAFNKAVVGRNAFAHESGIHQAGVIKNRATYEVLDATKFGQQSVIVDGKHAGKTGKEVIEASNKNTNFGEQNVAVLN